MLVGEYISLCLHSIWMRSVSEFQLHRFSCQLPELVRNQLNTATPPPPPQSKAQRTHAHRHYSRQPDTHTQHARTKKMIERYVSIISHPRSQHTFAGRARARTPHYITHVRSARIAQQLERKSAPKPRRQLRCKVFGAKQQSPNCGRTATLTQPGEATSTCRSGVTRNTRTHTNSGAAQSQSASVSFLLRIVPLKHVGRSRTQ